MTAILDLVYHCYVKCHLHCFVLKITHKVLLFCFELKIQRVGLDTADPTFIEMIKATVG